MGGFFDAPAKEKQLAQSEKLISAPGFWDDSEAAQKVVQQRSRIERALARQKAFETGVSDAEVLFEFALTDAESAKAKLLASAGPRYRNRARFSKSGRARFLGHLTQFLDE